MITPLPSTPVLVAVAAGVLLGLAVAAVAALVIRSRISGPPVTSRTTSRVDDAIRHTSAATTLGLAVIAAAISYDHLRVLAQQHGESGWRAHAFPLSVDGMEIIATLVLLADKRAHRPSAVLTWVVLIGGFAASLFANMAVAQPDPIARAIAAWPSVALLAAIKLLSGLLEHAPLAPQTEPTALPRQAAAPAPGPTEATADDTETLPSTTPLRPSPPNSPPARIPVDVMRRVPVTQTDYDRWRHLWAQLHHHPDTSTSTFAERHGISRRQTQWIRAAGAIGLLDSPIPPAVRLVTLTTTPPTPTPHTPTTGTPRSATPTAETDSAQRPQPTAPNSQPPDVTTPPHTTPATSDNGVAH